MSTLKKSVWIVAVLVTALAVTLTTPRVTVAQAPVEPQIVRDTDNPDRSEIVRYALSVNMDIGVSGASGCLDAVPPGKRLIVEHISADATMGNGQWPVLRYATGRDLSSLVAAAQGTVAGRPKYVAAEWINMRVAEGETFCVNVYRSPNASTAWVEFRMRGYVINYP